MNKIKLTLLTALLALTFTGCISPSSVDEGMEATLVKKPFIFGHGGVDHDPVATGLVWTAFSTSVVRKSIKPFNVDEIFDDLVTSDNNPVDFKLHLKLQHIEGKTPILVENFGEGWYINNVREPLRNIVRNFTKSHKMFDMTTNKGVTDELQLLVMTEVSALLKSIGMPTVLLQASVGKVLPPEAVIAATIKTAVQKQNVKTQNERVSAENARAEAEKASARADKAYMLAIGMDANQYLQMKKLDIQKLAVQSAADGKIALSLIMGGDVQPMYNIK